MAIERFSLRETPVITARLITGEAASGVAVAIFDKDGNPISINPGTAFAEENVAGSGKYDHELDFVSKPISGKNYYDARFTGSLQTVWKSFSWDEIVTDFDGRVVIDTVNGVAGQGFPIGTLEQPSNNLADAKAIADRNSILRFYIHGALTLDRDMSGYQFEGDSVNSDSIALANQNVAGCNFYNLTLSGAMNAATAVYCNSCYLNSVTDFNGVVENVAINTSISVRDGGVFNGNRVYGNSTTGAYPVLDLQNSATVLCGLADFSGLVQISNMAAGALCMLGGNVLAQYNASCVGGIIIMSGHVGNKIDNSGAGCLVLDYRDAGYTEQAVIDTNVDAIKAKTDNLPTDPASETNVNANETKIDAVQSDVTGIKNVTDALPDSGALTTINSRVLDAWDALLGDKEQKTDDTFVMKRVNGNNLKTYKTYNISGARDYRNVVKTEGI